MIFKFLEDLLSKIRESRAEYEKGVLSGNIKSMEDYRDRIGHIKAFLKSEAITTKLYNDLLSPKISEDVYDE